MKTIIFILGYPGSGKTTYIRNLMSQSTLLKTLTRDESPFKDHPYRGRAHGHDIGYVLHGNSEIFVVAGCHKKKSTAGQGADVFQSMKKKPVIDYLFQHADIVLWDTYCISKRMLKDLKEYNPQVYVLNVPIEEAKRRRRDARTCKNHHSAKRSTELNWMYNKTASSIAYVDTNPEYGLNSL